MRLFLDTSVLLSAAGSARGASREIFRSAAGNGWLLIATPYVVEEVVRNLPAFPIAASTDWIRLRQQMVLQDDVVTLDRPAVFPASKDRPVLFGALAWADVLLTLDRGDFGSVLGGSFYGLAILKPGMFLERERTSGRLKPGDAKSPRYDDF